MQRIRASVFVPACGILAVAALLAGCEGGDVVPSSTLVFAVPEVEPTNDTAGGAPTLDVGQGGQGTLTNPGDVDHWSIAGVAGGVLRVEIFGVRFDQPAWEAANNVPRLELLGTDGTTLLVGHDPDGDWSWGRHDLDIEAYLLPATGTYTIRVSQANPALAGGGYLVTHSFVDVGPIQTEAEASGATGVNETAAAAQPIVPGVVAGFHVDAESDFYSFAITAPTIVSFELKSYRNGVADGVEYYDPEIYLVDADGTTTLESNDDSYFYDSAIDYVLTTPGTYFLNVDECCGAGDSPYLLFFRTYALGTASESEPNDQPAAANALTFGAIVGATAENSFSSLVEGTSGEDWYSFTGEAGDAVLFQIFRNGIYQGSAASVSPTFFAPDATTVIPHSGLSDLGNASLFLPAAGTYFARLSVSGDAPYAVRLLRYTGSTPEVEPNDGPGATSPVAATFFGEITLSGDADLFPFTAAAGQFVRISVVAQDGPESNGFFQLSGFGSSLAPTVAVRDAMDTLLLQSPYDATNNSCEGVVDGVASTGLGFVAPAAGTYWVEVTAFDAGFGSSDRYVVVIR